MINQATLNTRSRGPLTRVASEDFAVAQEFLQQASLVVVPEDQTQRQAFGQLMPQIYVLRSKGCSFRQLATLLVQCGLKLQPDTVRRYYGEMLADRMAACERQMGAQIEILAAVKRETQGIDLKSIAGMVDQTISQRKADASAKLASMMGTPIARQAPDTAGPVTVAPPPARSAAPSTHHKQESVSTPSEPPMTGASASPPKPQATRVALKTSAPPGEAPSIPQLRPRTPAAAPTPVAKQAATSSQLKCAPLKSGIQQVKKRDNVPAEVYLPGQLEHPAIPNLFLSLDERLYGAMLEVIDDDGTIQLETMQQKQFRLLWKTPVTPEQTRTSKDFTKMDMSLFSKQP